VGVSLVVSRVCEDVCVHRSKAMTMMCSKPYTRNPTVLGPLGLQIRRPEAKAKVCSCCIAWSYIWPPDPRPAVLSNPRDRGEMRDMISPTTPLGEQVPTTPIGLALENSVPGATGIRAGGGWGG
jgi:hypothetical protein